MFCREGVLLMLWAEGEPARSSQLLRPLPSLSSDGSFNADRVVDAAWNRIEQIISFHWISGEHASPEVTYSLTHYLASLVWATDPLELTGVFAKVKLRTLSFSFAARLTGEYESSGDGWPAIDLSGPGDKFCSLPCATPEVIRDGLREAYVWGDHVDDISTCDSWAASIVEGDAVGSKGEDRLRPNDCWAECVESDSSFAEVVRSRGEDCFELALDFDCQALPSPVVCWIDFVRIERIESGESPSFFTNPAVLPPVLWGLVRRDLSWGDVYGVRWDDDFIRRSAVLIWPFSG